MPIFTLDTNVPKDKIPTDFIKTTSALIAETLTKPESYCIVHLRPNQEYLSFGGTTAPCGYGTVMCIGKLGPEENKKHSAKIFKHIHQTLGIPPDRLYIQFIDPKPTDIGYKGSTLTSDMVKNIDSLAS